MKKLSIITTLISNIFFLLPTSALGAMMVNAIQGGGVFVSQNAHTDIIRIGDHIPEGGGDFYGRRSAGYPV